MSTTYDVRQISFAEKLHNCSHVVVGVIDGIEQTQIEQMPTGPRVLTVFGVKVVRVEFGSSLPRRISVRVVGGKSGEVRTPWTAAMEAGRPTLFVLAPDYGTRPNQFVPCFGAVHPLTSAGEVDLASADSLALRTVAGAPARGKITPRLVGNAANATRRTVARSRARVRTVTLDRVVAVPTDVPEAQIPIARHAVKRGVTRTRKSTRKR
jgi:hypothetical protein